MVPLFPTVRHFDHNGHQGIYYTLMMSTGLKFGTISALFGLNHQIITQSQYSHLVATVIASVVIPTALANACFLTRYLLPGVAVPTPGSCGSGGRRELMMARSGP